MPLSLICDCGARFEVEDALAGQTVACPECQQPLKAPAGRRPTLRTSGFALASFLLAVVGAFTVVGTAAAVVLGALAVVAILRDRERLAGLGFAAAGIVLGLVFTTLTLWALTTGELFGLDSNMRRFQMADQLEPTDPKAPLEIKQSGFSLTRPSWKWAKAKAGFQYLLIEPLLRKDAVLLLVRPDLNAFVDVQAEASGHIASFEDVLLQQLRPASDPAALFKGPNAPPNGQGGDDPDEPQALPVTDVQVVERKNNLPADDANVEDAAERTLELKLAGKRWTVLARAFQARDGKLYIVRAYTETARFARIKDELVQMLDGFKITPGP